LLTLHAADLVLPAADATPLVDAAVAVDGRLVAAVAPLAELAVAYPQARTRRWAGLLTPGLVHRARGRCSNAPTTRTRGRRTNWVRSR
jgi:hypothetical protein